MSRVPSQDTRWRNGSLAGCSASPWKPEVLNPGIFDLGRDRSDWLFHAYHPVVTFMLGSLWSSGESAASLSCPLILSKPRDLAFQSTNPIMSFPTFMFALEVKPRLLSAACRHGTPWPFAFLMWLPAFRHPTSSNAVAEFLNMFSHTLPPWTFDTASNGFLLGKIQPTPWDTVGRPFLTHLWIYSSVSHHLLHKYLPHQSL